MPLALAAVAALTLVVLTGMRRSSALNVAVVSVTLLSLVVFVVAGVPTAAEQASTTYRPFFDPEPGRAPWSALLYASALMFVAYTGYGRIATLGEEVVEPERTIPRAIIAALVAVMALYAAVALVGVGAAGSGAMSSVEARTAPLEIVARSFGAGWIPVAVAIGAVTAMLGVLLNLVLGLSRVLLAMGRRGDMPRIFGRLDEGDTPVAAVVGIGVIIALLALVGDVRTTWSFSAFTVLVYYAITNLAALALTAEQRRYPRWVSWAGLFGCLSLAAFVAWPVLAVGVGLALMGLLWHRLRRDAR